MTTQHDETVIPIEPDSETHRARAEAAGKAPAISSPPHVKHTTTARKGDVPVLLRSGGGISRGLAAFDFLLRIVAFGATLAAAIATGTSNETLGFFTQFFQFRARFDDFPAFTFFVVGNALAAAYLVLSLPFSAVTIMRPHVAGLRILLLIFDLVMVTLTTAAASSAAAIVYLAHKGNARANWVAICQQFNGFCERTSGAVIGSFIAVVIFMLLVIMSAFSVRKY
ncbi:hypothetical protein LUZ60_016036 [Juncus effusus]|nr:hypothetical protein LUZ60_016036 [Juncus effusus]